MGASRERILEIVREIVGPLVRADGGQLHLVALAERSLSLHLTGRFCGCPGNTLARRRVLEPVLIAHFPDLKIEITSGPLLPPGAQRGSTTSSSIAGSYPASTLSGTSRTAFRRWWPRSTTRAPRIWC